MTRDNGKSAITDGSPAPATSLVRLKNLRKSFGANAVLHGINMEFRRGAITVVLGPSGCGKSVMLKHIPGLLKPDSGEVWFEDRRVDLLPESRLGEIRQQIGFLFQQGALFDSMNVYENVAFPLREHTAYKRKQIDERVHSMLAMVGMQDAGTKMPADLSGGQRKRVALARAIVLEPKVVLYDEPTTGLDPIRSDVINELILKLNRDLHVTSIVVTHDLRSAFKVASDMYMLYDGQVVMRGSPEQFQNADDQIVRRFLQGEGEAEEAMRGKPADDASVPAQAVATRSPAERGNSS